MPPRVRITKEEIIRAATALVREQGADALNARTVAAALQCSTQPIFSNFATMEELRLSVVGAADALFRDYMRREQARGEFPAYKASGMAYIGFASEERELFKLLYMRDRAGEAQDVQAASAREMTALAGQTAGLAEDAAGLFHLEMWAAVHGVAAMVATGFLSLDRELVSRMLTDVYQGLKKRYADGE